MKKFVSVLRTIYGYSILVVLFAGCVMFAGYMAALIIGGDAAAAICEFVYKQFAPVIIKITTSTVLFGLVIMYLDGEVALTVSKKKNKK